MYHLINTVLVGLNKIGVIFYSYTASIFVQSAFLVILLFIIDLLLRKRVRAVFRYCIWLLVLVKLVLPPSLSLPTGIGYWASDRLPSSLNVSGGSSDLPGFEYAGELPEKSHIGPSEGTAEAGPPITATKAPLPDLTWKAILFILWLMGVFAFLALLVQRARFVKALIAASSPANAEFAGLLEECRRQIGVRLKISLRISETISSPAVCGFFRPIILIPAALVGKISTEGLRAILIHELAHIKRADLWVNFIQTILQVVYFYNPFVWFANSMIRKVCEEAVDETVLVTLGGRAQDYSNTLIDIGEMTFWKADLGLRLIGVAESKKALQWRIKHMLTRPVPKSTRIGMLGTATIVFAAAVLLPMAKAKKLDKDASPTPQATSVDATREAPVAGDSNVFVDPNTGIELHKVTTISGSNDVVKFLSTLNMSPNGKFLLCGVKVIPLDGSKSFDIVDTPKASCGSWSPNGKWVTFYAGAIWVLPVDPETGHPTGPAEKLLGGNYWWQEPARWSRDSESIIFSRRDRGFNGSPWTLSLKDKSLAKVTDWSRMGKQSPDGRYIAYTRKGVFWVKPIAGGEAKKIGEVPTPHRLESPLLWSADDAWVLFTGSPGYSDYEPTVLRFFRLADSQEVKVSLPMKVGGPIAVSPDQKKLFFYRDSYDPKDALRVVSVSGGPSCDLGTQMSYLMCASQFWSPDSKTILAVGEFKGHDWNLWGLPLAGGVPVALRTDISVPGKIIQRQLSPDLRYLLVSVGNQDDAKPQDLWAASVSWREMRTTGPGKLVFKHWTPIASGQSLTPGIWSPDGNRIAVMQAGTGQSEIWIASPEGGEPVQLTSGPGLKIWPAWSPDGKMIAFVTVHSAMDKVIQVVSASGGEARTVIAPSWPPRANPRFGYFTWSPDGKALTVVGAETISSVSIADGSSKPLVNLRDLDKDEASGLRWSPDGKTLAFRGTKGHLLSQRYLFHSQEAQITELLDTAGYAGFWSPDGKWISYGMEIGVKTRPEGVLWEMDVEEALAKLAK